MSLLLADDGARPVELEAQQGAKSALQMHHLPTERAGGIGVQFHHPYLCCCVQDAPVQLDNTLTL